MAITCIFAATLMEKFGRRLLLRIASALFAVCWMILYFSENFCGLLFGRFMTGFCAGLTSPTVAVYIGEITQPAYRGLFLSLKMFCGSLGVLIPHALGLFTGWEITAVICALVPLLGFLLMAMVPESPPWLVRKGRIEEAEKSFIWFRGKSQAAMDEFEKMVEGQISAASPQNNSKAFHNILTIVLSKSFYKPLTILFLYNITIQASGPNVLQSYSMTILQKTIGEHMNEYVASIILDVTKLVMTMVACVVVKNIGRRPLTAFSGLATAGTLLGLSAYLHYASMNERLRSFYGIPLALYVLYIVSIAIGLLPLAVVLTQELLPLKYRAFGSSFVILFNYFCTFIAVKISPALFQKFGESGVYVYFGTCCFIGTMIVMVLLPETRNKTSQEIEDSYRSSSSIAKLQAKNIKEQQPM